MRRRAAPPRARSRPCPPAPLAVPPPPPSPPRPAPLAPLAPREAGAVAVGGDQAVVAAAADMGCPMPPRRTTTPARATGAGAAQTGPGAARAPASSPGRPSAPPSPPQNPGPPPPPGRRARQTAPVRRATPAAPTPAPSPASTPAPPAAFAATWGPWQRRRCAGSGAAGTQTERSPSARWGTGMAAAAAAGPRAGRTRCRSARCPARSGSAGRAAWPSWLAEAERSTRTTLLRGRGAWRAVAVPPAR